MAITYSDPGFVRLQALLGEVLEFFSSGRVSKKPVLDLIFFLNLMAALDHKGTLDGWINNPATLLRWKEDNCA